MAELKKARLFQVTEPVAVLVAGDKVRVQIKRGANPWEELLLEEVPVAKTWTLSAVVSVNEADA